MEKYWRSKAEGIDAIHDAAVAGDNGTVVFHSAAALDRGHDQPTAKPHQCDDQGHQSRLPGTERSDPPE
jgi:hypothetical protein